MLFDSFFSTFAILTDREHHNMAEVEMIMPKMGESIIEATIITWLKNVGDTVQEDETILEIATDKVDSEVPSPVSGVITKILCQVDEVVAIGQAVAIISTSQQESTPVPVKVEKTNKSEPKQSAATDPIKEEIPQSTVSKPMKTAMPLSRKSLTDEIPSNVGGRFYSPLVRNIARAEGISLEELNQLKGSGVDGRITKFDLLNYLDLKKLESTSSIKRAATTLSESETDNVSPQSQTTPTSVRSDTNKESPEPAKTNAGDEIIKVSRMRKVIASHMMNSLETSAHVTSFIEADTTRIVNWRNQVKAEYQERFGDKLSLSPLFAEAVIKALRDFPEINASFDGDNLILKQAVNLGIATAMDNGNLIVPVIQDAGELNLHGLAKKLNDLTGRARINKLKPHEITGGTFTISNIGTFGNIMGTPIISQPQLAVLALGAIKKKPVIQETQEGDIIAIRHMMFLSLSFDHRVIDGYKGGVFLNRIAHYIETFDNNRPL